MKHFTSGYGTCMLAGGPGNDVYLWDNCPNSSVLASGGDYCEYSYELPIP